MRKLTLLVALLTAASVSIAEAAPKKKPAAAPEDPNANSIKFMKDGLPLVMPSAVMYYMLYQKQTEAEKEAAAKAPKTKAKKKAAAAQ